jgi:predicted RNA-binding Zn ribbon-like protein
MVVVRPAPETIRLQGGALSLDFANTVDWTADEAEVTATDALLDRDSLERWGARLGVGGGPAGADELERARALRAALHHVFSALAADRMPGAAALARLHADYAEAVAAATLAPRATADPTPVPGTPGADAHRDGFALHWGGDDPRRVRFAVAADAIALLGDPGRLARLHRCPGRDCGWIFLDMSGRRRWCSMATCGSREKMRRMYARRRAQRMRSSSG